MKEKTVFWKRILLMCLFMGIFIAAFEQNVLAAVNPNYCNHVWSKATCTKAPVCEKCNTPQPNGSKAAHSWQPATCTTPKTCRVCKLTSGSKLGHSWSAATCTSAMTCTRTGCNVTSGSKLGHNMTGATCTSAAHCTRCPYTEGSKLGHSMSGASCTSAKHCTRSGCSYSEGSPLGHSWNPATCTSPSQCARCHIYNGNALGHSWSSATCNAPKTCSRYGCNVTEGNKLGHVMVSADCTTPAHCVRSGCSYTEGGPLGHSLAKATCTSPAKCTRMGCSYTEGSKLGHSMTAADCTTPAHCTRNGCSYTEGKPLGHSWNAATCTSPRKCARCYIYDGEKLGHDWAEAGCFQPKTCKRYGCHATEGEPLGHTFKAATVTAPKTCTKCGFTEGNTVPVKVTFVRADNGASNGPVLGYKNVYYGKPYGQLTDIETMPGYQKIGWSFSPNGKMPVTADTEVTYTTDHIIYACTSYAQYTVSFDVNGGDGGQYIEGIKKSVTYGMPYGELPAAPSGKNLEFLYWSTKDGTPVTSSTTVTTIGNHTLYAQWHDVSKEVTVSFDANGGYGQEYLDNEKKKVTYGEVYGKLPAKPSAPEGMVFTGWYSDKLGGAVVTENTLVGKITDHTLYAHWKSDKKLNEDYIIVTDDMGGINYYPYYDTQYDQLFTCDTKDYDINGNRIYGIENLYGANPGIIDEETAKDIYNRLVAQAKICGITVPGKNLGNFVPGMSKRDKLYFYGYSTGTDCIVNDATEIMAFSSNTNDALRRDTAKILSAVFETVNEGDSFIAASSPSHPTGGIEFPVTDLFLWAGIKSADTSELVSISFDGKNYNIRYKWYLYDYYDWDKAIDSRIGVVSPQELYYLHLSGNGLGKNYINIYKRDVEFSFAASGNRQDDLQRAIEIALGDTIDYSDINYYRYIWADGSVENIIDGSNGLPTVSNPTFEFDFPVITPLPTGTPRPTVPPTQAPASDSVVTPVVTPVPETTPAVTEAPVVTPAVTSAPVVTPAVTSAPVVTPAVTPAPVVTPAVTSAPETTPVVTAVPAVTPIITPVVTEAPVVTTVITPVVTAVPAVTPVITPVVTESPVVTPAVTQTPFVTLLVDEDSTNTPVKTMAPVNTPVVTPAPTTTPIISQIKKEDGKTVYELSIDKTDLKALLTNDEPAFVKKGAEVTLNAVIEIAKNTLVCPDVPHFEKEGTILKTSNTSNVLYQVTKSGNTAGKVGEVTYVDTATEKSSANIKSTVKIDGITYRVTGIGNNEFQNNKKLKKVTIGDNVETIGSYAFAGCQKLKTIIIKSSKLTAKTVDATAFEGISSNAVVKVPADKVSKYKKMFKKLGVDVKVKSI